MIKTLKNLTVTMAVAFVTSCAILREPTITRHGEIDNYRYIVVPATANLSSSTGAVFGGEYGLYGATTVKEVNPSTVIEGIMLKKGFTSINEIRPEIIDKTLIVKYGESGKRYVAGGLGGYTLEVTIVLIDAKTYETVFSCTAEGQGATEADDIREAISRCISEL